MNNKEEISKSPTPETALIEENTKKTDGELIPIYEFRAFTNALLHVMKEVSVIADKRLSVFLLTLGTTFLFLIIFLRLRPLGLQVSELSSVEFIVLVLVATLLLTTGVYLQFYQYQKEREFMRSLTNTGTRIIEKSVETSARIQEKSVDAAVNMTGASIEQPRDL